MKLKYEGKEAERPACIKAPWQEAAGKFAETGRKSLWLRGKRIKERAKRNETREVDGG